MAATTVEAVADRALARGVDFLWVRQLVDGEFPTLVWPAVDPHADGEFDSTVFTTALVVYALRFVPGERAAAMRARAVRFLVSQQSGPGVWRFWTSKSQLHRWIPPDLDDTCCALFALRDAGVALPPSERLVLSNRSRAGLFYTWLLPGRDAHSTLRLLRWAHFSFRQHPFWQNTEAERDDIDGVVNANTLLYLGDRAESRLPVDYLLGTLAAVNEASCDKWHLSKFNFYYMVSRAYFHGVASLGAARATVVERIAEAAVTQGGIETALDVALAACSLLNFDADRGLIGRLASRLVSSQAPAGGWPRSALFFGGPKRVYGWGSEELTTAVSLEALARYIGPEEVEGETA